MPKVGASKDVGNSTLEPKVVATPNGLPQQSFCELCLLPATTDVVVVVGEEVEMCEECRKVIT
jgi:hypothetical protein